MFYMYMYISFYKKQDYCHYYYPQGFGSKLMYRSLKGFLLPLYNTNTLAFSCIRQQHTVYLIQD